MNTAVMRSVVRCLAASMLAALMGCATVQGADGAASVGGTTPSVVRVSNPKDPLEPWNRKVYAFNDALDEAVLKPVARAYVRVVPSFARTGVGNFFGNFGDAWSAVNHFLQGKVQTGLEMTIRVAMNSVLGLGGVLDIASEAGIDRQDEDFGQTLGRWGVPAGAYLVWPLLGPSSVRETAAMPLDRGWSPSLVINDAGVVGALTGVQLIDTRARLLNATRLLDDVALDKYVFTRDAYLSRRRSQVYDGDPPDVPEAPDPDAPVKKTSALSKAVTLASTSTAERSPPVTTSSWTMKPSAAAEVDQAGGP